MLLRSLQANLATLYETPLEHCVLDYLITDARQAAALQPEADHTNSERLLLRQSEDALDVALYIAEEVLCKLAARDPYTRLDERNLNDFLIALEGVSHFNYVVWNAGHAKQVTQLELELQAEVDKFVTALMLLDAQGATASVDAVHDSLFVAVRYDQALDPASERRYRDANRFAGKYCSCLARRFPAQHREPSFVNELRRFYRLPQNDKIRLIESAQA